jgi:hypothetical protein
MRLWVGNNAYTFSRYPIESIDKSTNVAIGALDPAALEYLRRVGPNSPQFDHWFYVSAMDYITAHPWLTVWRDVRKIVIAFSVLPSPRHSTVGNLLYLLSYGPVLVLAVAGMVWTRSGWREQSGVYLLFVAFGIVAAAFFSHTSHRAYLDIYLIVFAAAAVDRWQRTRLVVRHA